MILNIGAGKWNRIDEELELDINLSTSPDVCANAEKLPFKDKTFKKTHEEIYAVLRKNKSSISANN